MHRFNAVKVIPFLMLFLPFFGVLWAQQSDFETWESNYNLGSELLKTNQTDQAIINLKTAYEIAKNKLSTKDKLFGDTADQLAKAYTKIRDYKQALNYYNEAIENAKHINNDSLQIDRLRLSANLYRSISEYDNGIKVLINRQHLIENKYGKNTLHNAENLLEISIMYKRNGEFQKAIIANKTSTEILKSLYGDATPKLADNLTTFGQIYGDLGEYDKALNFLDRAFSLIPEVEKQSISSAGIIFTKALLFNEVEDFVSAIEWYEKAKAILGSNHSAYTTANASIALAYTNLGDYQKAMTFNLDALSKTPHQSGSYSFRLQNLAYLQTKLGDYNKAISTYELARSNMKDNNKLTHHTYGQLLNNIGKMYRQMGDLEKAQPLFKDALDIFLNTYNEDHIKYGYQLNDYANTLFDLNQYDDALVLLHKNIELSEKNQRINTQEHFNWQFNLAKAYNKLGRYNEALPLALSASENTKSILGDDHIIYATMLKGLSQAYIGLNTMEKAIPALEVSNNIFINEIDKVFRFRTEKEKRDFMTVIKQNFDETQSIPVTNTNNSNSLNSLNLNNQLLLKGLLLNNSKDILTQLGSINDSSITSAIQKYRSLKSIYNKALSQPFDERKHSVDSLKEVINIVESDLVKSHSSHFKNSLDLKKDWRLSRSNLNADEAAIEFTSFNNVKNGKATDSTMYAAYIYKKDWKSPKMIPLFEERLLLKVLDGNSPNQLYTNDNLYNLIWQPLESQLKNTNLVYYSPSGLLNQIPFPAIKNNDETLASKYNLVQLSSTAILKDDITKPQLTNTLFIGGIDYDYTETISKKLDSTAFAYLETESLKNSKANRSRGESWTYLPGSSKEVEGLQAILNSNEKSFNVLTGKEATEDNFKKLSGNSPNILHIATHGFFYENLNRKRTYGMSLSTEDQYRLADDPLLRSGLILAGANYAWKNGSNPYEEEDGILTAMEISNLDLSNTEMVVLSACETGLGDIDGSEGVYGLQRAFKMAGVNIIVMSLWQVPDAETAEFMNHFYSEWMTTNNVRGAFNSTQRQMQKKYANQPKKWAAFVLFE